MDIKHLYYFFIGTEAELIKMTPVLAIFNERGVSYKIISSGQNVITNSDMLKYLDHAVDIYLQAQPVHQSPFGLIKWFIHTFIRGIFILRREFRSVERQRVWFVIHGDTVSTVLGAVLGRIFQLKIAHVEAGYKSPNLFYPFPEELDRTISSYLSDRLFCPYDSIGKKNLHVNKKSIDIGYNTSIDSLSLALNVKVRTKLLTTLDNKKFFIFALHRQETLINKRLFTELIETLLKLDKELTCLFALHHPTKQLLQDLNLLEKLRNDKKIIITPRLSYFEYVHALNRSEFIMTDGVGNQQETYYLGKPCLILRNQTEGLEGLGKNAVLNGTNTKKIHTFLEQYKKYKKQPISYIKSPSTIIADNLLH